MRNENLVNKTTILSLKTVSTEILVLQEAVFFNYVTLCDQ